MSRTTNKLLETFRCLQNCSHVCKKILIQITINSVPLTFDSFQCLLMLNLFFGLFWIYILNIQWRWSLCVCILCGLLSCDSSHICKKCCCVFGHRHTLDDNSDYSMEYKLSLMPKVTFFQWAPKDGPNHPNGCIISCTSHPQPGPQH